MTTDFVSFDWNFYHLTILLVIYHIGQGENRKLINNCKRRTITETAGTWADRGEIYFNTCFVYNFWKILANHVTNESRKTSHSFYSTVLENILSNTSEQLCYFVYVTINSIFEIACCKQNYSLQTYSKRPSYSRG